MNKKACPLCEKSMEEHDFLFHSEIEEILLDLIKKNHPQWVTEDGACPLCVERYKAIFSAEEEGERSENGGVHVSRKYNDNLRKALELTHDLREFAVQAAKDADDDSCRGVYSQMIWDSKQYKELIEKEVESHKRKDKWD